MTLRWPVRLALIGVALIVLLALYGPLLVAILFSFVNKWLSPDGRDFVLVHTRNDRWASIEGRFEIAESAGVPRTASDMLGPPSVR